MMRAEIQNPLSLFAIKKGQYYPSKITESCKFASILYWSKETDMSQRSAYKKATIEDLNESLRDSGKMTARSRSRVRDSNSDSHAEAKRNLLKELGSTRHLGKGDYDIRINTRD